MSTDDLLPPTWRGLLDLFRYHPFWHTKYREEFGAAIVTLSALCQVAVFLGLVLTEGRALWPIFILFAFMGGSLAALILCSEIAIIFRYIRGRQRGLGQLVFFQGLGLILVISALAFARQPGSIASVANGRALYPFIIGLIAIGAAPLAIWEGMRK